MVNKLRKVRAIRETTPRRRVSASSRELVLLEAGYKCGSPACRNILTLDLHHIHWVKDGGGSEPSNLLPLCGYCHDQHTKGHISATAIRVWKGVLIALNTPNRSAVDTLLHLHRIMAPYMRGWRGYFGFCETPDVLIQLTR